MKTLLTLLTIILINGLCSCEQKNSVSENEVKASETIQVDTSVFVVLPFDSKLDWVFKTGKPTELNSEDLLKVDSILNKCISDYNPKQEKQFQKINSLHPESNLDKNNFIIELSRYKRQYIPIINSKGEKEVWVNCFCGQWSSSSKTSPVIVMDGGNCFFNLKINLKTGKYYELIVNGDA